MAIDNGNGSVTVVKGDSLSAIAKKYYKQYGYSTGNSYMSFLAERNNITNVNLIMIGQVIWLTSSGGSTGSKNTSVNRVTDLQVGQLSNSEDTVLARWSWKWHSKTDHYLLKWMYSWGAGVYKTVEQKKKDL